ncbi:MAG: preQ(1) synthase [Chloroflexota bacterium]
MAVETRRPGEAAIAEAELEAVPNPSAGREYAVELSFPEFTCKCPRTGYPDFATVSLVYTPNRSIVELKSFKLYLNRYRDRYAFHEKVTNQILDDFVGVIEPVEATIVTDWNVRGNVHAVVRARYPAAPIE